MGTYNHVLKPFRRGSVPGRFVVLAAAAQRNREHIGAPCDVSRLQVGAARSMSRKGNGTWACVDYVYQDTRQLLELLDQVAVRKGVTWVVAHDLAYHLQVSELWLEAMQGRVDIEGYHLTGRYCTARLKLRGKVLHCVDTSNFLDCAWEKASQLLGCTPANSEGDSDSDARALDQARAEVETVAALVVRLTAMMETDGNGSWGWSLGSLAWQSWRRGLMSGRVHVHDKREAIDMERAAYTGGRVECRFLGSVQGRVHVLDYNSLYAHCMAAESLPCKLDSVSSETPATLQAKLGQGLLAIAEVRLDAREHDYPVTLWPLDSSPPDRPSVLPSYLRNTTHWRRTQARGTFTTTLATPELKRALHTNAVESVQGVAWFVAGRPFERFTRYWYAARLKFRASGQAAEEAIAKRILTMLPGKFGQHANKWQQCPGKRCKLAFGHWYEWEDEEFKIYRAIAGVCEVYCPADPDEWEHAFPAISAHVTSAARVCVDMAVAIAGEHDCYYYDTDCLHVSDLGLERLEQAGLLHETELGKLKLKGSYNGATYRNRSDWDTGALVRRDKRPGTKGSGENGRDSGTATAGNTLCPCGSDATHPSFASLHGGSVVNNLTGTSPDAWRSYVVGSAMRRNWYVGRVASTGWVTPLILPLQPRKKGKRDRASLFGG